MTIFIEVTRDLYDPINPSAGRAAYIAAPFAAKDYIKELPSRRWDRQRKRWVIPAGDIAIAVAGLGRAGWQVEVIGQKSTPPPRDARPTAKSWADQMFAELPARFHVPVHNALAKILHPDIGGDNASMQQLNAARDRAKGAA